MLWIPFHTQTKTENNDYCTFLNMINAIYLAKIESDKNN